MSPAIEWLERDYDQPGQFVHPALRTPMVPHPSTLNSPGMAEIKPDHTCPTERCLRMWGAL